MNPDDLDDQMRRWECWTFDMENSVWMFYPWFLSVLYFCAMDLAAWLDSKEIV